MSNFNTDNKSVTLLFLGTDEDKSYAPRLKQMVGNAKVFVRFDDPSTLVSLTLYCKEKGITGIFTTNTSVLTKLVALQSSNTTDKIKSPSLDNYAGSMFVHQGIEFLIIHPLALLMQVSYMPMLTRRFISKLAYPENWYDLPKFQFELLTSSNEASIFERYSHASIIAIDIETLKEDLQIRCIGYTAVFISSTQGITCHSCVLPIDSDYAVAIMRKFNWELQAPKVFQNGKYDCLYLARYNAVPYNYIFDTVNMSHAWYVELPKDLGFLGALFIRNTIYWKDLANTSDLYEYYKYNALDTYGTAFVALLWLLQAPDWAKRNYLQEFPLVFPCHMCELIGIKRDMPKLEEAKREYDLVIDEDNKSLSKMIGTFPKIFNVNSVVHNRALRKMLGASHITSSDEKSLKKIGNLHPINKRITNKILDLRGNRKLTSTYLTNKELDGRILYSLNPHGTDSGRLASRESAFWCGLQIQNIPRGKIVKQTLIADAGFMLAECDSKQAETRDTAYISGEEKLITACTGEQDFHALNASAFFGVPYSEIFDDATAKTLDKALRDLAKRVNHGANYLMGANVLIDTMGEDAVWKAKRLLKLPSHFDLKATAEHLLESFHKTYPHLRAVYYPAVVNEIVTSNMLVSHATIVAPITYSSTPVYADDSYYTEREHRGWTRYCFGDPVKNKLDKNMYVAHVSQSANAMRLNVAFLRVFYEIAINPKYADNFKLLAQIHDSILFQFRIGHEYLMDMVRERMEVPVIVKSYDGKVRRYTVPADVKSGKDGKGAHRWSETE